MGSQARRPHTYLPVGRRPMALDERIMARELGCVVFPCATSSKRIARELAARVRQDEVPEISLGEARALRAIVYRFRRQLRDKVVALALTPPPPLVMP